MDIGLVVYLTLWYLGNYYYNSASTTAPNGSLWPEPAARRPGLPDGHTSGRQRFPLFMLCSLSLLLSHTTRAAVANCIAVYNKNAGKVSGGAEYAFTLALIQLIVGSVYAIFLWAAPEARKAPKMTFEQVLKLAPLGFWAAVAHAGAVYAMTAGAVSFGQIVKAGEPVFACIVGYFAYNSRVSMAKLVCLIPVIGGIAIASAKVCAAAAKVAIAVAAAAVPAWQHHSTAESARERAITDTDDSRKRTVRRVVLRCRSGRHRHCPPRSVQRFAPPPLTGSIASRRSLSLVLSPLLYVIPWRLLYRSWTLRWAHCSQPRLPTSLRPSAAARTRR